MLRIKLGRLRLKSKLWIPVSELSVQKDKPKRPTANWCPCVEQVYLAYKLTNLTSVYPGRAINSRVERVRKESFVYILVRTQFAFFSKPWIFPLYLWMKMPEETSATLFYTVLFKFRGGYRIFPGGGIFIFMSYSFLLLHGRGCVTKLTFW